MSKVVGILRLSVWAWDITPAFYHLPLMNPFSQAWGFLFQQHLLVPPCCANQLANMQIKAWLLLALKNFWSPSVTQGTSLVRRGAQQAGILFWRIKEIIQKEVSKGGEAKAWSNLGLCFRAHKEPVPSKERTQESCTWGNVGWIPKMTKESGNNWTIISLNLGYSA